MENSFSKHLKKKQFGKSSSSTSVEKLKSPKNRRKSLGSVLTSNVSKTPLDLNRRKSVDSVQISKKSKKRKVLENSPDDIIGIGTSHNAVEENSPTPTAKKAVKSRLRVKESSSTSYSKSKKKIQLPKSASLVLPPPLPIKEESQSGHLGQKSKTLKKVSKNELNLEMQDKNDAEIKARFEDIEKKFSIKSEDVENAVKGVTKFAANNPHLQNQLFNEEIPLFLQINSFKIPKTKGLVKQLFRVPMTNSILPSDADICLIVPDVKGVKNNEHEKHIDHYESLLRSKDVTGIKKIMTFHELRTEYETFELKNRLVDLYDVFLVDGKISGKVVSKCGSIFYNKRKVPIAVKLYLPKLKSHIDKALKKAYLHLNVRSDSHTVQIGHSKNNTQDVVENVYSAIEFLDKQFPGKMNNIRSLNVYAHRGSSIPIYVSLKDPNDIKVPTLSNKKPKAYKTFSGELTTQYNADVVVRPTGQVIVKRKKVYAEQMGENPDDNITDAEIFRENARVDQLDQQNGDGNKNSKGGNKRKLSGKDQRNNPEQFEPKKKKVKKQATNMSVKQEVSQSNAERSKGKKGKKRMDNTNVTKKPNAPNQSNSNKMTQKPNKNKKSKVVATTVKTGKGKKVGTQMMAKNKIKKFK